ncbi:MAG: serine/threonine protein kinase, partial [Planctomycetes bacterium]|nr:serine/threonine protein kinase [Planctomycetota bacterium]
AIAALYEAGESELGGSTVAWFAMELVDGAADLLEWARRRELSRRERVALFVRLGEAVEHGHRRGVLHRDLKPGNVLVSADGDLKLIDFGIARALGGDAVAIERTAPGAVVGTFAYMSPEQLRGDPGSNDVATDVWSLGVLFYRLLCDRPPFDLDGVPLARIPALVLDGEPVDPCVARPGLPKELGWILLRALAKDPEHRYRTVRELLDDLRRFERHEPVLAKARSRAYRLRKFARRHRVGLGVAAVLAIGLGTGVTFLVHGVREARAGARAADRGAALARETARVTAGMFDAIDGTAKSRDVRVHEVLDRSKFEPGSMPEPAVEWALREMRGRVYSRLRRFADARYEFEQAVALWLMPAVSEGVPADGRRSRELVLRAELGRVMAATGDRETGEAMVRESMAAAEHESPSTRIDVAEQYCALLTDAGANDDLFRQASALHDLATAAGQPRVARRAKGTMADAASALGRHDEAVAFAEAVWRDCRDTNGADASSTCSALSAYVRILQQAERLDAAEALYPDLVAATERVFGKDHENALVVMGNRATLLLSRKKLGPALEVLREVVRRYESRGAEPDSNHLTMVNNLGMVLNQGGKFADAEPHLRRAAELTRKVLDPRDPNGPMIRFNHGACLAWMQRWDAAKAVLLGEYDAATALLPAGHAVLGKMRRTIADACERNGEPDAAREWRSR